MKDYYLLVGLNSKEIKILDVNQKGNCLIEVDIENRKKKVRRRVCNKFTSSVHGKLKPIRSVYLESCGSREYNLLNNKKNVSLLRKYSSEINWWVLLMGYIIRRIKL